MINDLIKNKKMVIFFQPIVSIKNKKILGFEALTRAYDKNNELIMPLYLFEEAEKENLTSKLDNYVIKLAIVKFQDYYKENKNLLLFLNFESFTIDDETCDDFIDILNNNSINPSNIVIEIKENSVKNTQVLQKFVKKHKENGFIIAIDDFGAGHSSFNRLALIKPDIVKVGKSIISEIDNNFMNSEILTSISNMCNKIGALVIAEGVQSGHEILSCMKKDIDIFQGFWFSKAKKDIDTLVKQDIFKHINSVGDMYKNLIKEHINKKQQLLKEAKNFSAKVISLFQSNDVDDVQKIKEMILQNNKLEAFYMLEEDTGIQVGITMINMEEKSLYKPAKEGHDHSLKEYYFIAKESLRGDYLSGKYISKASGNMCRTYSSKILIENFKYIICFDILV